MTTPWPPRRSARRPLAPRVAAPREPVDLARIGRRVVRRRAKGMDVDAVAAALEDARFDARQDSRHEDLADDVRGPAELAEWERIDQLLAAAPAGTVYDPDTDDVVRAELAAEAAHRGRSRPGRTHAASWRVRPGRRRRLARPGPGRVPRPLPRPRRPRGSRRPSHPTGPRPRRAARRTARLVPDADVDQLAFAARLATAEPEAAGTLAVFLARARPEAR
ncbi:hypothetical protein ABZ697_25105 [Streptomyces albidoflavus]|uniref:hypothetical protein n=1 Tax=Streptomyces albidoflavus TaxID=1886 RepID=UPI003409F965